MQEHERNRTKLKGRLSPISFNHGKTAIGLHSKSEWQRAKHSLPFHHLSFLGTSKKTNYIVSILFLRGISSPFEPLWSAQEWDMQYILGQFGRQCRCGLIQITWVCVFLKGQMKDLVLGEMDRIRFPERKRLCAQPRIGMNANLTRHPQTTQENDVSISMHAINQNYLIFAFN